MTAEPAGAPEEEGLAQTAAEAAVDGGRGHLRPRRAQMIDLRDGVGRRTADLMGGAGPSTRHDHSRDEVVSRLRARDGR